MLLRQELLFTRRSPFTGRRLVRSGLAKSAGNDPWREATHHRPRIKRVPTKAPPQNREGQNAPDHASSDDCGVSILGPEEKDFWKDHKGARINAIRTRNLIESADVVVVRFGDKYRQWNAAFDAGYAAALETPIITLHDPSLTHALKEVNGVAAASAETPEQVVKILSYVITGKL